MLYETLSQPKLLIIFVVIGFCCGIIFDFGNFIKFLCSNKKISNILIDILQTSIILFILFIFNLNYNFGLIRFFPILIFILVFYLERYTFGKLFAKLYLSCYNLIIKLNNKFWRKKHDKANKIS